MNEKRPEPAEQWDVFQAAAQEARDIEARRPHEVFAPILAFICPPPCVHKWDGPYKRVADGAGESVTCSKCGADAMSVDMLRLP